MLYLPFQSVTLTGLCAGFKHWGVSAPLGKGAQEGPTIYPAAVSSGFAAWGSLAQ